MTQCKAFLFNRRSLWSKGQGFENRDRFFPNYFLLRKKMHYLCFKRDELFFNLKVRDCKFQLRDFDFRDFYFCKKMTQCKAFLFNRRSLWRKRRRFENRDCFFPNYFLLRKKMHYLCFKRDELFFNLKVRDCKFQSGNFDFRDFYLCKKMTQCKAFLFNRRSLWRKRRRFENRNRSFSNYFLRRKEMHYLCFKRNKFFLNLEVRNFYFWQS